MKGYGLVLSGGGAKGSYEIGVWKAIKDMDIPIVAITGTSIGALNGAMLVQGDDDLCELAWTNFSVEEIIDVNNEVWEEEKIYEKNFNIFTIIKNLITNEGLELTPLIKSLEQYIDEEKIRASPIDFGLVTYSLTDFEPFQAFKDEIPNGQLVDFLIASACFPVFKPVEIDNKKFIDGGFHDNVPISLIATRGIKDIIVVDISGFGVPKSRYDKDLNIIKISNNKDIGKTLDISPEQAKMNIELGYLDALKQFDIVKGKKYYIVPNIFDNEEPDIGTITRGEIRKNLGITKDTPKAIKKFITRKFFRNIDSFIDLDLSTNTAICNSMAEITAEILKINEKQIYTLKDLNRKILDRFSEISHCKDYIDYVENIEELIENKDIKGHLIRLTKEIKNNPDFLLTYFCFHNYNNKDDKKWNEIKRITTVINPNLIIASIYLSMLLNLENTKSNNISLAKTI